LKDFHSIQKMELGIALEDVPIVVEN
jgi:hypothetical protein